MKRTFDIGTDDPEIMKSLQSCDIPGVTIRRRAPRMTFDSAAPILHFIVDHIDSVSTGLFSAWLFKRIEKACSKNTTINGKQIPKDPVKIQALIEKDTDPNGDQSDSKE